MIFQQRAGAQHLLEPGDVVLVFVGLLGFEQDALGVGQAPEFDQRPGVVVTEADDLVGAGPAGPFAGQDGGVEIQALLPFLEGQR